MQTGGLQSGGLQSRATDLGSISALTCALRRLGDYSLGAFSLTPPILDLLAHLPVLYTGWGPTVWGPTVWRPTVAHHGFWISLGATVLHQRTYVFFRQAEGLQSVGLQSRTTFFGSISALPCFLHRLAAYSLGAYSLAPPILDLWAHLLVLYTDWGPTVWGPTVSHPILDLLANLPVLHTDWWPAVWGPTVPHHRVWIY